MNTETDNVTELITSIEKEMSVPHKPAELRALRKKYSKLLNEQWGSIVIRLAQSLLRRKAPGGRWMAYELIVHHPKAPSMIGGLELFRLGLGADSREAIDLFASYLVGPAWRDGRINDGFVEYWARSSNKHWRRGALIATISLNAKEQGGVGDARRTLAICQMLVDEHDEMVVRAMITALRELQKHEPKAVARFLAENRTKLAPRIVREFGVKLVTIRKSAKAGK